MRFVFKTARLLQLYTNMKGSTKYSSSVIDAFFEVMAIIVAAPDERDFYAIKSLHFEKLQGDRRGERSLRLNDQYRLVVSLEQDKQGKYLLIDKITDYH